MVGLVAVAEPLEDLHGVLQRGLTDLDGLEPALQGRVLLHVLAVLLQRGGPDGLQLPARQHRLENAGRVDGALGRPRTHQGVDLVDEQDDVPAGLDLLEDLLQPLFEVTAVTRPGHQRAQVQGVELLVLEGLGHLRLDDLLRQALDHGGLADPGLTDEHRVVLGAPREHLHDPLDFLLPADDRIELALPSALRQIPTELVQHQRGRRGPLAAATGLGRLLALVAGQELQHLLPHPVEVRTELDQHLGGDALAFADQAEQDVLGADVVVPELQRLAQRQLQHLLRPWGERDVTTSCALPAADHLGHVVPHGRR